MIFLTIGSHEPFDRLVSAVDAWRAGIDRDIEVFGQITARASHKPASFEWVETLPPSEYQARCRAASLIVSHAGMGSIITALTFGKPILILPRRGHLQETRNDHQYATAQKFVGRAGVWVALEEAELPALLDRLVDETPAERDGVSPFAGPDLIDAVRDFIHADTAPSANL